ncbi:MAG: FkbM family methyltransferase [Chloroflexota bacterium]
MSLAQFIYTEVLKPRPLRVLTNAILLRIIPRVTRVGPARVYLDPEDPVLSGAVALRVYEPSELYFFQKHCRADMVLVDIGANVGLYTALAMHSLNANGRIVSVEPRPQTFAFLERNIAENRRADGPRADALNMAAAAEHGARLLFQNPENKADNRLYANSGQNWEGIEVESGPLDAQLEALRIQQVNFVKADVQGYEQMALRGLRQTLHRSERVILMTEFWPKGLRDAGGDAPSYLQELTDLGFKLYELKETPRGKLVPIEDWERLIHNLPGRKYMNLVGLKGYNIS